MDRMSDIIFKIIEIGHSTPLLGKQSFSMFK